MRSEEAPPRQVRGALGRGHSRFPGNDGRLEMIPIANDTSTRADRELTPPFFAAMLSHGSPARI
jgi:hypothetical protein